MVHSLNFIVKNKKLLYHNIVMYLNVFGKDMSIGRIVTRMKRMVIKFLVFLLLHCRCGLSMYQ